MYSCGLDADRRKKEISELWSGKNISELGICDNLAAETSGNVITILSCTS